MQTKALHLADYKTFLLDATGVLYNDEGPILGAQDVVRHMQKLGRALVVTNNSNNYPSQISENFMKTDFDFPESDIISSGHGLALDPSIRSLIEGKRVFVFGRDQSHAYILDAGCAEITPDIQSCDVIVMTAIVRDDQEAYLESLISFIKKSPTTPVICCNPDKIVKIAAGRKYVVGHFARQLELATGIQVVWIGKPYDNFPPLVRKRLIDDKVCLEKVIFFDDNLENVMSFKRTLGVTGVWVIDSGISHDVDQSAHIDLFGTPDFMIGSLGELC